MGKRSCCAKEINKGAWSREEDETLSNYVTTYGEGKWHRVAQNAGLKRCGKSCRQRWLNYLKPGIKRGDISVDEEDMIIRLHRLLGNRWALIARRLPGRTDNEIKNYWNTNLSKKLHTMPPSWPSSTSLLKHCQNSEEQKTKKINATLEAPRPTRVKALRYRKTLENNVGSESKSSPSSSNQMEEGDHEDAPLSFLIDIGQNLLLIPDDHLNLKVPPQIENQNKVAFNNKSSSSSSCDYQTNSEKFDSLETLLDGELKSVASFLGLEDECRDLL